MKGREEKKRGVKRDFWWFCGKGRLVENFRMVLKEEVLVREVRVEYKYVLEEFIKISLNCNLGSLIKGIICKKYWEVKGSYFI